MVIDPVKVVGPTPQKGDGKDSFDAAAEKPASENTSEAELAPEYQKLKDAYIEFMTAYIKRDLDRDQELSRRGFFGGGKKTAQTLQELRDTDKHWLDGAPVFRVSRIMFNYLNMDNLNALNRVESKININFNHPIRLAIRETKSDGPYVVSSRAAKDVAMGYLDMAVALNLLTISFKRQGLIEDRSIVQAYRNISDVLYRKLDEYEQLDGEMTKALTPMRKIVSHMFDPSEINGDLVNSWDNDLEDVFYKISGLQDQRKIEAEREDLKRTVEDLAKSSGPKKPSGGTDDPGPS